MLAQSSALIRYEDPLHTPSPTDLHDRARPGLQTGNHRAQTTHPFQHRLCLPPWHGSGLTSCSQNCALDRRDAPLYRLAGDMSPEIFDTCLYPRTLTSCTRQPEAVRHLHLSFVSLLYQPWMSIL